MRHAFLFIAFWLASGETVDAAEKLTFEKDVRPILRAYCLDCHGGAEKPSGKLDLRLKRFALTGGKNGPSLVVGSPRDSLLIKRMKDGEMPPGEKKVPADQQKIIEQWIATGAATLRDEPEAIPAGLGITADERAYWFYQPLKRIDPPAFGAADRVRTPIDAFILAKLREKKASFNPDADKATLLKRATIDLTGLPPTQKELDDFLKDPSPDAYEKRLDQLLASTAYGERQGRHWLDVAGYSDSDGDGSNDTPRPHSWRYRDYVIRSLNADKPLNQFIVEQLAGDELVPLPWTNLKPEQIETLSATGFLRTAPDGTSSGGGPADIEQVITDTIKIISSSLLGSSVGCAQCHDHRYDPIPQADYYRLRAVFEPAFDPSRWRRPNERRVSLLTDADRAKIKAIDAEAGKMQTELNTKQTAYVREAFEKELTKFPEADRAKLKAAFDTPGDKRTPEQKKLVDSNPKLNINGGVLYQYNEKASNEIKAMQAKVAAKQAERPPEEFVAVMSETPGRLPQTLLFYRGDARQPVGSPLAPGDLTVLSPEGKRLEITAKDPAIPTSGRRLAWARNLTSGSHPLFGRTIANRIWLNHFGRGIVDTPGEFGRLGQLPTHPELLDWLATELPKLNWSQKKFHKLIMTSTVYRQSSRREPAKDAIDAGNALFGRFPVRRLEAEAVRDRLLTVTGKLDRTMFGPSIGIVEDAAGQIGAPDDKPRRSVYLQSRRSKPIAFLTTFDAPAGELNCERRINATSAPQALMLMNGEFVRKQSGLLAAKLKAETSADFAHDLITAGKVDYPRAQLVAAAWQNTYLRPPTIEELQAGSKFMKQQLQSLAGKTPDPELAALTNLCQQLLASNEFLYVD